MLINLFHPSNVILLFFIFFSKINLDFFYGMSKYPLKFCTYMQNVYELENLYNIYLILDSRDNKDIQLTVNFN